MKSDDIQILEKRQAQVHDGKGAFEMACDKASVAGSASQRACSFCGSRGVLYPNSDAIHIFHGPLGRAPYTWGIRRAPPSGPNLHPVSFFTHF